MVVATSALEHLITYSFTSKRGTPGLLLKNRNGRLGGEDVQRHACSMIRDWITTANGLNGHYYENDVDVRTTDSGIHYVARRIGKPELHKYNLFQGQTRLGVYKQELQAPCSRPFLIDEHPHFLTFSVTGMNHALGARYRQGLAVELRNAFLGRLKEYMPVSV